MRLINVHSLKFGVDGDQIPPYVILSHRWGPEEITCKDFAKGRNKKKAGYQKVVDLCRVVRERCSLLRHHETMLHVSIAWVWIDTCCIDKRSSAELSEAINSMFAWYRNSVLCYVHLEDVLAQSPGEPECSEAFKRSAWFTRGWTLQELLAPQQLIFCDRAWNYIGHKHTTVPYVCVCEEGNTPSGPDLSQDITAITDIDVRYLKDSKNIRHASIARRMSWAANRSTTRTEDIAYCLLGLFDVNLPLLYGEGWKAFTRLQEEILRKSNDQSIFAWRDDNWGTSFGMLARSPEQFKDSGDIVCCPEGLDSKPVSYTVTNAGLKMQVQCDEVHHPHDEAQNVLMFTLNCQFWNEDRGGSKRSRDEILEIAVKRSTNGKAHRCLCAYLGQDLDDRCANGKRKNIGMVQLYLEL